MSLVLVFFICSVNSQSIFKWHCSYIHYSWCFLSVTSFVKMSITVWGTLVWKLLVHRHFLQSFWLQHLFLSLLLYSCTIFKKTSSALVTLTDLWGINVCYYWNSILWQIMLIIHLIVFWMFWKFLLIIYYAWIVC